MQAKILAFFLRNYVVITCPQSIFLIIYYITENTLHSVPINLQVLMRNSTEDVGRVAQPVIATGYVLDGLGIESRWGEIFRTCPDRPWGPPCLLYNGYRVFPGGKEWPGRDADPLPPSSAMVMKG